MKTLYFDCGMGAAGDMLTAALLELMPDPAAAAAELNSMGVPHVVFRAEPSVKCGITGTHVTVLVDGEEEHEPEEHHHHHDHDHDHGHHEHHHSSMADIEAIAAGLAVSDRVKADVVAVYRLIAEAESHAHGRPVSEVHFHEVGAYDAVADVAAVSWLMERLSPERIIASPVHVGCGQVRCAHGILPVPAPATAHILTGVPIYGGGIRGELCTPTGAALLKHFAEGFGEMPVMRVEKIGCGMGRKDFPAANCVRAMLGETEDGAVETRFELSANVDDMTAEQIGFAAERLFEAGAAEVYTVPIGMKKSRPGTLIRAICRGEERGAVVRAFFANTTTIGVRETVTRRYVLDRRVETRDTEYGPVRFKFSSGYGAEKAKPEYDDIARIARERGISLAEAAAAAERALKE